MSEEREDQERPCLHCMMVELIDGFFAEHPRNSGLRRQQVVEQLMRQIMHYDVKFSQ